LTHDTTPLLADIAPVQPRGVIALAGPCKECGRETPILGRPGKGRPLHLFGVGYLCEGHTLVLDGPA